MVMVMVMVTVTVMVTVIVMEIVPTLGQSCSLGILDTAGLPPQSRLWRTDLKRNLNIEVCQNTSLL